MGKAIATKISIKIALFLGIAGMQAPLHALTATIANMTGHDISVTLYQDNCGAYAREVTTKTIKPYDKEKSKMADRYETIPLFCTQLGALEVNGKQYAPLQKDQSSFFLIEPAFNAKGEQANVIVTVFNAFPGNQYLEANLGRAYKNLLKIEDKTISREQLMAQLEPNSNPATPINYISPYQKSNGCYTHRREKATDIYDLTINQVNPTNPKRPIECVIWDTNSTGDKSFSVKNSSSHTIYVRIGYTACDATGFILAPNQTGQIAKAPGCIPSAITGHMYKNGQLVDLDHSKALKGLKKGENQHFIWHVENSGNTGSIQFPTLSKYKMQK